MQLTECGIGETARVVAVMGCERFRHRLALRGIAPGQICTVVSAACGPIVLAVDGGTVALGRGMAAHITVERNPDEKSNY
ncbi:MAG: FeoA family protein [Methanofollis liminatans]|jgi:Fe2+ transport system protein FeoA|uniref:FeoA family protein n=1 Tax=Methanofollis liminatans DSM 4140 TaxID=28892 RepID=J0S7Y0_9EURY|nr:FeoA family protein [Methanofollis liminatans]EJG06664.1 FeoA family protein [Methanofollis liminatans DSM 4140]MDD3112406.1 FeoA family protein [Methanofollis liminatans]